MINPKQLISVVLLGMCHFTWSQSNDVPQKKAFVFERSAVVNMKQMTQDFEPSLMVREMPKQSGERIKTSVNRSSAGSSLQKTSSTLAPLQKGMDFMANGFDVSTPNDNDMAVSDSGFLVSVVNTRIFFRDVNTDSVYYTRTLAGFASPLNITAFKFDPKVMYDPSADRFVLVMLAGSTHTASKVIIGFSQSSDPTDQWNLYSLPGNPLNNNLWTDYPMIAMTKNELFLTVNLLYNDSTWQKGFVETLIWQIDKRRGYAGTSMSSNLHSNIKLNGRAIRNLCPVKGGSRLYGPQMHFISNRNLDLSNDTVFLVTVPDTIGSPSSSVTVKVLRSPQAYYFPADGHQSLATQSLATNDCRNLGAFIENDKIQYVHNSNHPTRSEEHTS